jgi:hypothetical protein
MLPVFEVRRVYNETVCESERFVWRTLHSKAVRVISEGEFGGERLRQHTPHPFLTEVRAGQTIVFRIRKDHQIEVVADVESWVVKMPAIHLAALNMVNSKVMSVVLDWERHGRRSSWLSVVRDVRTSLSCGPIKVGGQKMTTV